MNTCETCIYWTQHRDNLIKGTCEVIECDEKPVISETMANINVVVSDDSGLMAELWTGKNFGCNQHKSK